MATQISAFSPLAKFGPEPLRHPTRAASRLNVYTAVDGTSGDSTTRETISTRLASSAVVLRWYSTALVWSGAAMDRSCLACSKIAKTSRGLQRHIDQCLIAQGVKRRRDPRHEAYLEEGGIDRLRKRIAISPETAETGPTTVFLGTPEVADTNNTGSETLECIDIGMDVGAIFVILTANLMLTLSSLEVLLLKPPSIQVTARSSPRLRPSLFKNPRRIKELGSLLRISPRRTANNATTAAKGYPPRYTTPTGPSKTRRHMHLRGG